MFEKIVVPLDGSALGQAAVPYALTLADATHAALDLVHVAPPLRAMWDYYLRYDSLLHAERMARAQETLDSLAEQLRTRSRHVETHVLVGDPAAEIVEYAGRTSPCLIALSTHGHGGIVHWAFGSVARKVLTAATVPTLIVRPRHAPAQPEQPATIRTILVPLDGSALAAAILPLVKELAPALGAQTTLARVVPTLPPAFALVPNPAPPPQYVSEAIGGPWETTERYLRAAKADLAGAGVSVVTAMLEGDAAEALRDHLHEEPYDLVVMTTHGRTGITRWTMGSVAERLVESSHTPVLLLRSSESAT